MLVRTLLLVENADYKKPAAIVARYMPKITVSGGYSSGKNQPSALDSIIDNRRMAWLKPNVRADAATFSPSEERNGRRTYSGEFALDGRAGRFEIIRSRITKIATGREPRP